MVRGKRAGYTYLSYLSITYIGMKSLLIVIIVLALLGLGGWYYVSQMSAEEGVATEEGAMPGGMTMEETEPTGAGGMTGDENGVKTFVVEGGNFFFSPNTMTVKKGDTVRITFKNTGGFHDFVLDEFDVATKQANAPAEETVEFVADKAGSFEYYCSVGKHRENGMKGTLTVTE
jgi:plastocyanin